MLHRLDAVSRQLHVAPGVHADHDDRVNVGLGVRHLRAETAVRRAANPDIGLQLGRSDESVVVHRAQLALVDLLHFAVFDRLGETLQLPNVRAAIGVDKHKIGFLDRLRFLVHRGLQNRTYRVGVVQLQGPLDPPQQLDRNAQVDRASTGAVRVEANRSGPEHAPIQHFAQQAHAFAGLLNHLGRDGVLVKFLNLVRVLVQASVLLQGDIDILKRNLVRFGGHALSQLVFLHIDRRAVDAVVVRVRRAPRNNPAQQHRLAGVLGEFDGGTHRDAKNLAVLGVSEHSALHFADPLLIGSELLALACHKTLPRIGFIRVLRRVRLCAEGAVFVLGGAVRRARQLNSLRFCTG